ncbi:MAG: hypothetical protein R3242_03055 [Akkermansiaceae bacterium]|nr:hypothetical protein [Akkermansiaceae bacterium]
MNIPISLLGMCLLASFAHGEGLPIHEDGTRYEGDHYLVELTEDQLEEVTVARTLTLTREQWKGARAHNPATGKRIECILPSTYSDCTCGMEGSNFGVWFENGTVAIVVNEPVTAFADLDEQKKNEVATHVYLLMDERGQFYEMGKLIPYDEVKARVGHQRQKPAKGGYAHKPSLSIGISPGSKASDPALASRLMELKKISIAADRSFNVFWDKTMQGE